MSTKASLHISSRTARRTAPGAARKAALAGKVGKIDSFFKERAGRNARSAHLRHQLLNKIVTAATEHVERIDDAEVPRVLRQLKSARTLQEALRITYANEAPPQAVSPGAEGSIPAENQEALERARVRAIAAKVNLLK